MPVPYEAGALRINGIQILVWFILAVIVIRWVRRIAKAGRTVHRAGKVVHRAGKSIRRAPKPHDVLDDLESTDPQRRLAAFRHVADMGAEGTPYLQQLLTDKNPKVRQWAAESLAHLRSAEAEEAEVVEVDEEEVIVLREPDPPVAVTSPAPEPEPEPEPAPTPPAEEIDGRSLGELVRALSTLSRLDPVYAERLAALRDRRRRFHLRVAKAEPTRAFDASPSLRDGTTLVGVLDEGTDSVAVRIPRALDAEEGAAGRILAIEGEFVAWDPLYDRAVFEGIVLD